MRAMKRIEGKWLTETPADLSKWLWTHDGGEAVVVDDATETYYCATEDQMHLYRRKWEEEKRRGDKRTAAMFIDLDKELYSKERLAAP